MYLLKNVLWPLFENKIHLPQGHLSTTLLHNKLVNNLTKNLYFFPTPKFWNPYFFPVFSEKIFNRRHERHLFIYVSVEY